MSSSESRRQEEKEQMSYAAGKTVPDPYSGDLKSSVAVG